MQRVVCPILEDSSAGRFLPHKLCVTAESRASADRPLEKG